MFSKSTLGEEMQFCYRWISYENLLRQVSNEILGERWKPSTPTACVHFLSIQIVLGYEMDLSY